MKMKPLTPVLLAVTTAIGLASPPVSGQTPLSTAFTYQGQLKDASGPVTGTVNMRFGLYDAETLGNLLGEVIFDGVPPNEPLVDITNGLFTVKLDFGAGTVDGQARWLEITVEATLLTPRQELTPAPHALALPGLYTEENGTSPNIIGGHQNNSVGPGVVGGTIGGGGAAALLNSVGGNFGTVGGGQTNTADGVNATVAGGRNNAATTSNTTVGGGAQNTAGEIRSTVGGGYGNTASGQAATVPGGENNTVDGARGTIGGGSTNHSADDFGTVSGGQNNLAGSADGVPTNTQYCTVAGGSENTAGGSTFWWATVGGGLGNTASGSSSTVGGGNANQATGSFSTVPGGRENAAAGAYSFAAGNWARADHNGTFVWSSTQTVPPFGSTSGNQFLINAPGGVGIGTNDLTAGYALNVAGSVNATDLLVNGVSVGSGGGGIGGGGATNYLAKFTGPTVIGDSIIYETAGNVGIGTTIPDAKLHVSGGNLLLDNNRYLSAKTNSSGMSRPVLGLDSSDQLWIYNLAAGPISFSTYPVENFAQERLHIAADGNVGIGISDPDTALSVAGDIALPWGAEIRTTVVANSARTILKTGWTSGLGDFLDLYTPGAGQANDPRVRITEAGRVGIGTTTPDSQLDIESSTGTGMMRIGTPTVDQIKIGFSGLTSLIEVYDALGNDVISLTGLDGRIRGQIVEITGADLAEKFPVSEEVKPGMVVEIDPDHPGELRVARGAYNRRVAGVVSGANDLSVGVILGNLPGHEDAPPIAMSGRVWAMCDAANGPIAPGDLLTTSDTPGHAMKVADHARAQGAIIGKAMSALAEGQGLVLVLVSLQ